MFPLHQSVKIRLALSLYQILHFFEKKLSCDIYKLDNITDLKFHPVTTPAAEEKQ